MKNFFKNGFFGALKVLSFQNNSTISSFYSWLMLLYEILFLSALFGNYGIKLSFPSIFLGIVSITIFVHVVVVKVELLDTFDLVWPAISLFLLLLYLVMAFFNTDLGTGNFLSSLISLDLIKNLIKNIFESNKKEKNDSSDKKIDEIYKKIVIQNEQRGEIHDDKLSS